MQEPFFLTIQTSTNFTLGLNLQRCPTNILGLNVLILNHRIMARAGLLILFHFQSPQGPGFVGGKCSLEEAPLFGGKTFSSRPLSATSIPSPHGPPKMMPSCPQRTKSFCSPAPVWEAFFPS
uniref:Uncharacterized protein n=1 Tax=Sphaerodactylus townsendi TaxID=933632 RepID=A0ACB8E9Z6_9SAUR